MSTVESLLDRVRRRKMAQWSIAYLAGAWLVLQVLDLVGEAFAWPETVDRIAIVALGVGFLGALVVAWFHGEKGQQRANGVEIGMLAALLVIAGAAVAIVGGGTSGRVPAAAPATADSVGEQGSIAVLPFADMSPESDQEYFSDGITEEILNVLAQLPQLRVAARTSSFAFKGQNVSIDSIARALRVAHILEGSVRKAGDQLRIKAQLIDARTGYHLWSATYDRPLADVFAVQDEISRAIADQLELTLSAAGGAAARRVNVGAHDLYLLGLERWSHRNARSLHEAVEYFERAVEADPRYARAQAGLALGYAVLPQYDLEIDAHAMWEKGRAAAARALELDPRSAEAHAASSQIALYSGDLRTAERQAREAVRLNPNYATGHQWLGESLLAQARYPEALAAMRRAAALDPLSAVIQNLHGGILAGMGETDAALRSLARSSELDPDFLLAHANASCVALTTKQWDVARVQLRALQTKSGGDPKLADMIVDGLSDPVRRRGFVRALGTEAMRAMMPPNMLAMLYDMAGARDSALALAGRAAENPVHQTDLRWIIVGGCVPGLAADPRLPAVLRPGPR